MSSSTLPTLPTSMGQVGSEKTQQIRHTSDPSDPSDPPQEGRHKNRGSLKQLVARWRAREDVYKDIETNSHTPLSRITDFNFSPTLKPAVGSVGSVGIVGDINGLHASDIGVCRSEVSEGCPRADSGERAQEPDPLADLRDWLRLRADEVAEWGDVPDPSGLALPSEAAARGLLEGYRRHRQVR